MYIPPPRFLFQPQPTTVRLAVGFEPIPLPIHASYDGQTIDFWYCTQLVHTPVQYRLVLVLVLYCGDSQISYPLHTE